MILPKGWAEATIGDIADTKLGKMLDGMKNKGLPVPYLRNINVRWGSFDLSDLQEMRVTPSEMIELAPRDGDLFVCEGGEPGRSAVWRGGDRQMAFQKALHRVRTIGGFEPDFVAQYLRHAASERRFADLLTGTTIKHLSQVALQRIVIPTPPATEQRRIVAKLNTLTARLSRARAELDRVPALIEKQRLSILRAGVTGNLTGKWREQVKPASVSFLLAETATPKQKRGGREATDKLIPGSASIAVNDPGTPLPAEWRWVPLLRLAKQETGHTPSRSRSEYWDGGIPWIGIRDAGAHHGLTIHETAQTISEPGLANSSARLLPSGTVCLSRTASIGYVTIMGRPMATSQDLATWTCTKALLPEYLMYALMAEGEDIRKFGMGSTHTTIYFPEIRAFHIALPPMEEQVEIVERIRGALAYVGRLEAEAERARALLDKLESAILVKTFRGELVPQDPNDEPASVLLERIRAERATASKPKRSRRVAATA